MLNALRSLIKKLFGRFNFLSSDDVEFELDITEDEIYDELHSR